MSICTKEKNLEEDIEAFLCSEAGGYLKCDDHHSLLYVEDGTYQMVDGGYMAHRSRALDAATLASFVQTAQPKAWERFERMCNSDPVAKFAKVFSDAVDADGVVGVLKHGFKHRGVQFKVAYFRPESGLNKTAADRYAKNVCRSIRQFHFAESGNQTIDVVLDVNGIPVVGLELKDQFTGQDVEDAERQWREDRDPRCACLKFNSRMVAFFAVDLENVYMTTKLEGEKTFFLPFNQGSAGAGNDGGAGNPANPNGYATSHLWEVALQRDSLLDIVNKFLHLEVKEEAELDARGREIKRYMQKKGYDDMEVLVAFSGSIQDPAGGRDHPPRRQAGVREQRAAQGLRRGGHASLHGEHRLLQQPLRGQRQVPRHDERHRPAAGGEVQVGRRCWA